MQKQKKAKKIFRQDGFTPHYFFTAENVFGNKTHAHTFSSLKNRTGFTLIELLVVIAVIALLASVILVALNNSRAKARDSKRTADMNQLAKGLELYYNDCGSYPVAIASSTINSTFSIYKGTAASCGDNAGGSGNGGLGSSPSGTFYVVKMPTAPTPGDSTVCQSGSNNSYIYRSYLDVAMSDDSDAGDTKAGAYTIQFCLGENTGGLQSGVRYLTPSGFR